MSDSKENNRRASTVVEIVLSKEANNPDSVYLYLEGNAWCAYERSAYYLAKMQAPVKLEKEVVGDGYDIVLLKAHCGVDDLQLPLSSSSSLKKVADDNLLFQLKERIDGFHEWKTRQLRYLSA